MPIPNNTLQVRVFINTPRGQWSNILYYQPASAIPADTDMVELANGIVDFFSTHWVPLISSDCQFYGVGVRYTSATVDIEGFSNTDPADGEGGAGVLPDQDCIAIRRLTSAPGRQNRGRIFISGISSLLHVDGILTNAAVTAAGLVASDIAQDLTLGGITLHARHWDRKDDAMKVVTSAKVLRRLVSRRDRAHPLPYQAV